ncbi:recombinase family protein [Vibrio astriarenae]
MPSTLKPIRFKKEMIESVDSIRGDVTFAAWVKRAVIQRLEREGVEVAEPNKPMVQHDEQAKRTTQEQREQLINDAFNRGLDYKQVSEWLNQQGYKPQRGEQFTPNSVRGIRSRMQKMGTWKDA